MLTRADNFLHLILQNAPVVIGHQDKESRYRFMYNHFPSLSEEDIIGKTDEEIFSGPGVKEFKEFKREVLERGIPSKREITYETELFGSKTFLMYVEPVFSKSGETIGVNYMGMEVTDQVRKREKMAKLREEIALQKAVTVMLSPGDLVLQSINDIPDLSKVESGVIRLEATKFREVAKLVLQTATASLQKLLTLEGEATDDVPIEVVGDVTRIRQILTNLITGILQQFNRVGIKL